MVDLDGIKPHYIGGATYYGQAFTDGVEKVMNVLTNRDMSPRPTKVTDLKVFSEFSRAFKRGKRIVV